MRDLPVKVLIVIITKLELTEVASKFASSRVIPLLC